MLPNAIVKSLAQSEVDPLSDTSMQGEVLSAVQRMQNGSYKEVGVSIPFWAHPHTHTLSLSLGPIIKYMYAVLLFFGHQSTLLCIHDMGRDFMAIHKFSYRNRLTQRVYLAQMQLECLNKLSQSHI